MAEPTRPTSRALRGAVLALAFALPARADFEIDAEVLERVGARARAAVEAELDVDLADWATVRLASPEDVEAALDLELVAQFDLQFDDPEDATEARKAFARQYAHFLIGKYSFGDRAILIVPENFERVAELLDEPALLEESTLYAVLVHEAVHAAQEKRYGWSERAGESKNAEALQALNAVVEGHAQLVARAICTGEAEREGFETFTRCISATPDKGSAAERMTARVFAATFAIAYHDGEEFVAHLRREGGPEAVDRAFREPPRSLDEVFRPEWYLDPSSRPAERFDLSAGMSVLVEKFPEEGFEYQVVKLMRPQLEAGLSLLPEEDVRDVLAPFVRAEVRVIADKEVEGAVLFPAVMEFETAADATRFLVVQERVMRAKDEAMVDGPIRIEEPEYHEVRRGVFRGLYARKRIVAGGEWTSTQTLLASRGPLSIEVSAVSMEMDEEELVALGTELLEATLRDV